MVDLRELRKRIGLIADPDGESTVTRRWLEKVERDLTELRLLRSREIMPPIHPRAASAARP